MATIVLKLKKPNDAKGVLYIQQIKGGNKRFKSLKVEMSKKDFECYEKKTKRFSPSKSKSFDSKVLNVLINQNIEIDLFEKDEVINDSLIYVWQTYIDNKIVKETAKENYTNGLKKLNNFLLSIDKKDIKISEIDSITIDRLIKYLLVDKKNTENTASNFFKLFKRILNYATTLSIPVPDFNFLTNKELGLKKTTKQRIMPNDNDIQLLFNIKYSDKHFYYANALRLSIGLGGLRFFDLFFLKYSDVTTKGIKFIANKTDKPQFIPFNDMIIKCLYNFYKLDNTNSDYTTNSNEQLQIVMKYSSENSKKYILHQYIDTTLYDKFDKMKIMSNEEYIFYKKKRDNFNSHLNTLRKHYKLSIPRLTTHYSRYIIVAMLIEKSIKDNTSVDMMAISSLLQHSSISQTEAYIKKNYNYEIFEKITKNINSIYGGIEQQRRIAVINEILA